MRHFGRPLALTVAFGALVGLPVAHAGKPPVEASRFMPESVRTSTLISGVATALCYLGESGAAVYTVNYIVPPDDEYYLLLHAADCAPCTPPDTSALEVAYLALSFPVPCPVPIDVAIVGATGDASCPRPDPSAIVCPEQSLILTPTGETTVFSLPLPIGCEIQGDAFLRVRFKSLPEECSSLANRPLLLTTGQCAACEAYNFYPGGGGDLCSLSFPGTPVMYVGVASCVTPVVRQSWGSLKVRYR